MSEETKTEKVYKCPACMYTGPGIEKDLPPVFKGQADSRGVYCPKCLQDWMFRNVSQMTEVKK
jgi:ribosomal protein L34E